MLTIQKSGVQASLHPSLQRNGELFVSRRSFFSATGEKFLTRSLDYFVRACRQTYITEQNNRSDNV